MSRERHLLEVLCGVVIVLALLVLARLITEDDVPLPAPKCSPISTAHPGHRWVRM